MTFGSYGLTAFQAQYWNGSAWVTVPNGTISGNSNVWKQITFSPITTTKIRIWITGSSDSYSRVTEVEAWGVPTDSAGPSTGVQWLISDHLGTPRMILDQTGNLNTMKRHDYLPFGEELLAPTGGRSAAQGYAGGDGVRQQFTAKERDNETGLDYFGARSYASVQGRFSSTDPRPVTKESFLNPQRWSLYVYVNNNPLGAVDPNGADGQGKGGDKIISVFLDYGVKDLGRRVTTVEGKVTKDVPNTSDWQRTKTGVPSGYKVELFGDSDVTGNKGLPQLVSDRAFNEALKNSEVVIYVGHGRGDPGRVPFQQQGIQVGGTYYTPSGTGPAFSTAVTEPGPFDGPKPETTASVVVNLSCDADRNGGAYFQFVGQNQLIVTLNSRGDGMDGGVSSFDALDKAANAFVQTYLSSGGNVQKAVDAANAVLAGIPGNSNENVGDEIKSKKVN
jgi:RHS repeat-associated protein